MWVFYEQWLILWITISGAKLRWSVFSRGATATEDWCIVEFRVCSEELVQLPDLLIQSFLKTKCRNH